jgi:hypothetical protein
MTYNKGQGQTFHKTLLDVTTPPFAHGHFYVGDSRVRDSRNVRFYLHESYQTQPLEPHTYETVFCDGNYFNAPIIQNVVHKRFLQRFLA